jgi:DNA-binding transcriptional MerR regulator
MDDDQQNRVVDQANALGISVKGITDQLRATEAINATLNDTVQRQDEEIARKDSIIADLSAKLDATMADLGSKHDAMISIHAIVRETFAQQRGDAPATKKQLEHDNQPLPYGAPRPRIVQQEQAVG